MTDIERYKEVFDATGVRYEETLWDSDSIIELDILEGFYKDKGIFKKLSFYFDKNDGKLIEIDPLSI